MQCLGKMLFTTTGSFHGSNHFQITPKFQDRKFTLRHCRPLYSLFRSQKSPEFLSPKLYHQVLPSDLFGMVKWPFRMVKWPPTRGWKGHKESPGRWFNSWPFDPLVEGHLAFERVTFSPSQKGYQQNCQVGCSLVGRNGNPNGFCCKNLQLFRWKNGETLGFFWFPNEIHERNSQHLIYWWNCQSKCRKNTVPGNSAGDLFGMVKTWPF